MYNIFKRGADIKYWTLKKIRREKKYFTLIYHFGFFVSKTIADEVIINFNSTCYCRYHPSASNFKKVSGHFSESNFLNAIFHFGKLKDLSWIYFFLNDIIFNESSSLPTCLLQKYQLSKILVFWNILGNILDIFWERKKRRRKKMKYSRHPLCLFIFFIFNRMS